MLRILRHPSGRYLLYLLAQRKYVVHASYIGFGSKGGLKHIIQALDERGVHLPNDLNELDILHRHLKAAIRELNPPVIRGTDKLPESRKRWLKAWRIYDLWARRPAAVAALNILGRPELRRSLEIMLLGPLTRPDIALYLRKRWGLAEAEMNVQVVRMFEHYFWNVETRSMLEWHDFIYAHVKTRVTDYATAIHATRDSGGIAMTLAAADRGGSGALKPLEMYETMRAQMFSTFMNHARLGKPGFNNTMAMSASAKTVLELDDNIERLRGGSVEVLEQFSKIHEEYDPNEPISIRALPIDRPANPQDIIDTEAE